MSYQSKLLNERQAAEYLGVSPYLLQRWRCQQTGPDYVRMGGRNGRAIRYPQSALDSWIDANTIKMGGVV